LAASAVTVAASVAAWSAGAVTVAAIVAALAAGAVTVAASVAALAASAVTVAASVAAFAASGCQRMAGWPSYLWHLSSVKDAVKATVCTRRAQFRDL
jgi:hypothetical protein